MARLGVLRQGDLRCFAGSLLVVVFFTCVFLFTLTPEKQTMKLSVADLPRDELIELGSQPDHRMQASHAGGKVEEPEDNTDLDESTNSLSKSNSKNDPKNKLKGKWLKDELPSETDEHNGGENTDKKTPDESNRPEKSLDNQSDDSDDGGDGDGDGGTDTADRRPGSSGSDKNPLNEETSRLQQALNPSNKDKSPSEVDKSVKDSSAPAHTGRPAKTGKPEGKAAKATSNKPAASRKIVSLTDLNSTMLHNFTSPFIESPESEQNLKKVITWYNTEKSDRVVFKRKPFDGCPLSSCKVVYPLPEDVQADAVLFQGPLEGSPPVRQHKDQVFVFYEMESPESSDRGTLSSEWNGVFNWTWSYREDSDVWQPLGLLRRQAEHKTLGLEYFQNLAKDKSRLIAWLSDTCPSPTQSKRDEFVTDLANHIRVHRLGACGEKTSCGKDDPTCAEAISKNYFFLLVLEDDICKDHVTEVFYRAWEDGMKVVPVVRGGADYVTYFPQGTFINADWFDSAQQLGEYLIQLANNKKLYSEILWRKTHWIRSPRRGVDVALCRLCKILHQIPTHRKHYPDIRRWYEQNVCRPPKHF